MDEARKQALSISIMERNIKLLERSPFRSEMEALAIIEAKQEELKVAIRSQAPNRQDIAIEAAALLIKYSTSY